MLSSHAAGFHMPGEYSPHAGCWMLWPERPDVWRVALAQQAFAAVARAIAAFEPVTVGASSGHLAQARRLLPPAVRVVEIAADDAWVRDTGPTFITNDTGQVRAMDWAFNAWGGLYAPFDQDLKVAARIADLARVERIASPFVLEGGSIHVDGEGTLLTTEECLLSPSRNPGRSRAEIEAHLKSTLGVSTVIWLPRGVYADETSGHVDNMACFIRPGVVALTWTDDRSDPQYERSVEALAVLEASRDAWGRRLEVHRIHQPGPLTLIPEEAAGISPNPDAKPRLAGDRLAGSYINFYIANGGVVMAAFGDPQDEPAARALQALFPERAVVAVPAREILLGGGNIHCITQQQPKP